MAPMFDLDDDPVTRMTAAGHEIVTAFAHSGLDFDGSDPTTAGERGFELAWERLLAESGFDRDTLHQQVVAGVLPATRDEIAAADPEVATSPLLNFAIPYAACLHLIQVIVSPDDLRLAIESVVEMCGEEDLPQYLAEAHEAPRRQASVAAPTDLDGWLAECAWVRERLPLIRSCRLANGRTQRLTGPERLPALVAERRGVLLERDDLRRCKQQAPPALRRIDAQAHEGDLLAIWLSLHVSLGLVRAFDVTGCLMRYQERVRRAEERARLERLTGRAVELELVVEGVEPQVSRRLAVDAGSDLYDLHLAIQAVMEWDDCHGWQFESDRAIAPDDLELAPRDRGGRALLDPEETTIEAALLGEYADDTWRYRYDFGDDWCLRIAVLGEGPAAPGESLPSCRAATNAAPPEDCGGPLGYTALLQAFADPDHPRRGEMEEWLDADTFDPHHCDRSAIDRHLARLRPD